MKLIELFESNIIKFPNKKISNIKNNAQNSINLQSKIEHNTLKESHPDESQFDSRQDYFDWVRQNYKDVELTDEPVNFDNWVIPPEGVLRTEYKIKTRKPEYINSFQNEGINIFNSWENFKKAVNQGKIAELTPEFSKKVNRLTSASSLEQIENDTAYYRYPRFPRQILHGFLNDAEMPLPLIINNNGDYTIIAGNTRQQVAKLAGFTPKALIIPGKININESSQSQSRIKTLNDEEIMHLLHTKFSQAFVQAKKGNFLFRGVNPKYYNDIYLIYPRTDRKPRNKAIADMMVANYAFEMLGSDMRKNNTVSFSTTKHQASFYGKRTVCLPENGAKFIYSTEEEDFLGFLNHKDIKNFIADHSDYIQKYNIKDNFLLWVNVYWNKPEVQEVLKEYTKEMVLPNLRYTDDLEKVFAESAGEVITSGSYIQIPLTDEFEWIFKQ